MSNILFNRRVPSEPIEEDRFVPASFNAPRGITASAALVDLRNKKEIESIGKRRQTDKWQAEAWDYYDLIGEVKASANLIANVLSRINLYPAYVEDAASIPSNINSVEGLEEGLQKYAEDSLFLLESGNGGTAGLLRDAALNLFVVGECWLVKEPAKTPYEADRWQIRSVDEIINTTGKDATAAIKPRRDSKPADYTYLPRNQFISRIWRSHPRYSDEADSSMRGLLDICDELLLMGRTSRATAKSRLNAGMLFIPDGITNMTQSDSDDPEVDDEDSFEEQLIDAMVTPIADEASASAVVPLVVRGPEDMGEKIKFIKFERTIDPQIIARSEKLLDRILAGLDIPLDVAKGLSGVKYSNAILIEEQLYKAHIEPLVLMIVDCLTIGFLRPYLRATGMFPEDQINKTVIWYDPSAITAKPSKAEAATTGYGIGAVSKAAWRRYNGFAESDAPSELEVAQRFANERGALSETLTEALVKTMVPAHILEQNRQDALGESDPASANALGEALGTGPVTGEAPVEGEALAVEEEAPSNPVSGSPKDLLEPPK